MQPCNNNKSRDSLTLSAKISSNYPNYKIAHREANIRRNNRASCNNFSTSWATSGAKFASNN